LLGEGVALLARLKFGGLDGVRLKEAVELSLIAPEGINIRPPD
jgi:hypothetical protein